MNCPNCNAPKLRTTETFNAPDKTWRTKKCQECNWTFTSHETIADAVSIPRSIRNFKHKRKSQEPSVAQS